MEACPLQIKIDEEIRALASFLEEIENLMRRAYRLNILVDGLEKTKGQAMLMRNTLYKINRGIA